MGTIRFNGQDYPGAHEPLLSTDLFRAVQLKLGERHQTKIIRHNPLFKGVLRCEDCGAVVTWQYQKGRYYGSCQRRTGDCKGRRLLREDRLEESLLTRLSEIDESSLGPKRLRVLIEILHLRQQPYIGDHRLLVMKTIKQQINRMERIEDSLYDDKLSNLISEQRYKQKADKLHDELDYLRMRLGRLELVESQTPVANDKPTSLSGLYVSESKIGKRIIIQKLLKITIRGGLPVFVSIKN